MPLVSRKIHSKNEIGRGGRLVPSHTLSLARALRNLYPTPPLILSLYKKLNRLQHQMHRQVGESFIFTRASIELLLAEHIHERRVDVTPPPPAFDDALPSPSPASLPPSGAVKEV